MLVVAVVGSPNAGGRTRVAVDAMLCGAAERGARTKVIELADTDPADAVAAIDGPAAAYTDDGRALHADVQELAELHGRALVELATAVRSSTFLRELLALI